MKRKRFWKWTGLISLICLVLLILAPTALAFEGRGGDTVVIGADEVVEDDLYGGANTFTLDGTIKMNSYHAGTQILDQSQTNTELTAAIDVGGDWQSFTAGLDGLLTVVEIQSLTTSDWDGVQLTIYEGEGTAGPGRD